MGRLIQPALAVAALSLSACGANHHSIYRHQPLGTDLPSATIMDAKQRALFATRKPLGDTAAAGSGDRLVVCAEPSPDVFTVLAQAASATGSFGQSPDPKSIEAAASLAYSSAEQGTSLARTQTINMLREAMYRTCERYLNGGIGELELPIQAVRDQRLMVATLAIEQLTAAAAPRVVSIGASGSAAAGASANDAVVKLAEAQGALTKADAAQKEKQAAYDALEGASPACSAIKTKADANETLTADETTKQGECSKAEAALATAKTARQTAAKNLETLEKAVAQGGGGPASAGTSLQAPGVTTDAAAAALSDVAAAVTDIVRMNYEQDEVLLLCVKTLQDPNGRVRDPAGAVASICNNYIQAKVDAARAREEAQAAEYRRDYRSTMTQLQSVTSSRFALFLGKVTAPDGNIDPAKLKAVVGGYVAERRPAPLSRFTALSNQTTLAGLQQAFGRLPPGDQDRLAN